MSKQVLVRGLISACLKHVVKLDGLALGVLYSFRRFDFFTFGNSYGRLIRRKGLLIPFVSISLFFCRRNWLTEGDLRNWKTAFNKLSTFSAASSSCSSSCSTARKSWYRFFALSALSAFALWSNFAPYFFLGKLQCGHPIYVVLMPVRSWLPINKILAAYPFSVKHVFRFRVSATDRFYFYFSLRSVVSSSSNSPCCEYHWRYSIKSNQFISVTSTSTEQNSAKNRFNSNCLKSWERLAKRSWCLSHIFLSG